DAAKRCYKWCMKSPADTAIINAGSELQACIEMFKATKEEIYRKRTTEVVQLIKQLQNNDAGEISGFFHVSLSNHEPYKNIWNGCQALIGLCDMVQLFPSDKKVNEWKTMLKNYADNYLMAIADKNNFGIVPWGLYKLNDPGGNRKAGACWYRYFMQPEEEWWVGINSNVASAGIGLLKASHILKDRRMKAAAQKQLDWILGCNPYNSSTMVGTGYNHPQHFPGSSFIPTVPVIIGAVLNGLGGDHNDMPVTGKGDWQISEYWTPMVAHTLWLMAELSAH
ncbi:MAG TPA: glycoside hydrolase family 9 protein, partial [Flavitalea sp.]|nr:glycoside hydrolase family 9 protein [Flavitalea sp.]